MKCERGEWGVKRRHQIAVVLHNQHGAFVIFQSFACKRRQSYSYSWHSRRGSKTKKKKKMATLG